MTVTIYHNPDCGTSRNTLAMIRQSGLEPTSNTSRRPRRVRSSRN
jgi:arsenate reductase-like glutaredoxin family protein